MKFVKLSIFIIFSAFFAMIAEENAGRINFGIGYNINFHQADFRKIGEIPNCCPKFENGSGSGLNFQFSYDMPISGSSFLSFGLDYVDISGNLSHDESVDFGLNGARVPGIINYSLDGTIPSAGFFIQAKLNLFSGLYFDFGPRIGYLLSGDFTQIEKIIEPSTGISYSDGTNSRNNYDGEIPNLNSLQLGVLAGISYDFFLDNSRKFILTPNIRMNYSFSNISNDVTWKAHFASASIGFKYHFFEPKIIKIPEIKMPEPPKIDTPSIAIKPPIVRKDTVVPKILPKIKVDITHSGLDREGNEIPNLKLFKFEEFLSSNVQPLLSYIFFDNNSAEFVKRLKIINENEANNWSLKNLKNFDALETYTEILNIIATRMKALPNANITLVGCNSDFEAEKSNLDLSKNRAEKIKEYLTQIWKINPNRIKTIARNLPEKPSNISISDGIEENRRVEIVSDNDEILEPIISYDTLRDANPPTARFKINIQADLKKWKLTIANKGKAIKTFQGKSDYQKIIDWQISKDLIKSPDIWTDLTYFIEVEDTNGQNFISQITPLPVEVETIQTKQAENKSDKTKDKYSLILFDFNSSELTKANKKIADLIKSRINPESEISIFGYADRTGLDRRNEQLAKERGDVTAVAIERKDSKIYPVGSKTLIYDNDLPEGRFYSRTVSIIVETPINNK